jgi:hypothetical protein
MANSSIGNNEAFIILASLVCYDAFLGLFLMIDGCWAVGDSPYYWGCLVKNPFLVSLTTDSFYISSALSILVSPDSICIFGTCFTTSFLGDFCPVWVLGVKREAV